MNHKAAKALNVFSRGAVLLTLLVATQIQAGSNGAVRDGAKGFGAAPDGSDRAQSVQGLGSNDAFERRRFSSRAPSKSAKGVTARAYLEDYQRVPQAVGRKHPTQPHVLGKGKRRQ